MAPRSEPKPFFLLPFRISWYNRILYPFNTNYFDFTSGHCQFRPAKCGVPRRHHGTFTYTGVFQGHEATLTCDEAFEISPKGSQDNFTCHVTGNWLPLGVRCTVSLTIHVIVIKIKIKVKNEKYLDEIVTRQQR